MFTGLVSALGAIAHVETGRDARRFTIESPYAAESIPLGASIAHAGCCLTVVDVEGASDGARHAVEVSNETLSKTTLGAWTHGGRVNLERSLRAGDELGGHLVAGHVDGVGRLIERAPDAGSLRLTFESPPDLARMIATKGSIAVDGVSLTVNAVDGVRFAVNIIPHTGEVTTLGALRPGDAVNLEADLVARYLARLVDARAPHAPEKDAP